MKLKLSLLIPFLLVSTIIFAQKTSVKGIVKDEFGIAIENVTISNKNNGTTTDADGKYELTIEGNKEITILFSHISFKSISKKLTVPAGKTLRYSPILEFKTEKIKEIVIKNRRKEAEGIENINIETIKKIPSANAGVENILMTFAGVNNNNELSTQYNVRGGNFDENLVYVNGIEVYRPFLIRSGQQEGLSFVNVDMTQNVNFSAGGFQAKYGDKLSSVLDITYKTPQKFEAAVNLNLLGGSATVGGKLFNDKLSALIGIRYRDNSLLVNSKDINTNYNPNFTDIQTFLTYYINPKLKIDFLGNIASNKYNYTPLSRRTKFGTIANPLELIVFYEGQEKDAYQTVFGALKGQYIVNDNLNLSLTTSSYNTQEEEHYDILASYNLGEVNNDLGSDDFGEVEFSEGIGSQLNHARNDLDAFISNIQLKGTFTKNNYQIDAGIKVQFEDIKDRLKEWEVIDSLGFSVRPPNLFSNNQPYEAFEAPLTPYQNITANNHVKINRLTWFAQYSKNLEWNEHKIWYNIGLRAHNWNVSGDGINDVNQIVYSPRAQFAIKPNWDTDMLFRISVGMYAQPPFYKELRNQNGEVQPEVDTQKSIHIVAGNDYSFELWNRPFKLITEAYYKNLTNVNPYTVDNVRIRYEAVNNAKAYAYGLDLRLNGEFVPGTESWVSIGYLKTEENIDNQGYIARPTDQRLKFAMLFQDYVPTIPNLKMYLNLVYNTGVPGGSPSYADPYQFQTRLNDYKRADLGISYVLVDAENKYQHGVFKNFKELAVGVEIFNMFDVQNSITNTWVRDVYSKRMYGIANYMTSRIFNVKLEMKF